MLVSHDLSETLASWWPRQQWRLPSFQFQATSSSKCHFSYVDKYISTNIPGILRIWKSHQYSYRVHLSFMCVIFYTVLRYNQYMVILLGKIKAVFWSPSQLYVVENIVIRLSIWPALTWNISDVNERDPID